MTTPLAIPSASPALSSDASGSVPHLTTAMKGPLMELESHLLGHQPIIERWFRSQWRETPPPFYASVDLRNAGFKVAPVDTNLFPAGFNNLDPSLLPLSIQAVEHAITRACPDAIGVLLIPENHTRNLYYLESVAALEKIVKRAGYQVRVGSLSEEIDSATSFDLPSGASLTIEPITREGDRISVGDFSPCIVLLNNDFSGGTPAILDNLEQRVAPPLDMSWSSRLKSEHFGFYSTVAREFAELTSIDPWLIDPIFRNCGEINFRTREGEDCLASNVDATLHGIRKKYADYGIEKEPFVVVKADAGTYGMGIMTARSSEDVIGLNRKQRNKMASAKGGADVHRVIIQEGVYTFETLGEGDEQSVAEPVIYMVDQHVVGGFYRVHTKRGDNENLNAPGMHFHPLAFHQSCNNPDHDQSPDAEPNRFYTYGVIARLALLAAGRELEALL